MSLPEQNADAAEHPTAPRLPYTAPEGGRAPPSPSYYFEVIKSGVSLEPIDLALDVSFLVVGRLPICDVPLEHPSVSRYHAVIQFHGTAAGPALYDLGSAHGTYVNRRRLPPRTYQAVHVGDHVVFGESTRVYVLQSSLPPEPFIEPPVIAPAHHRPPKREAPVAAPPDAAEAVASSKVPFYAKDPRRVLRDFLERSGYDDDLQFRTVDPDQTGEDFVTYVVLPSELLTGVDAEFSPGRDRKKKASQNQAALHACEELTRLQLLGGGPDGAGGEPRETAAEARRKRIREMFGDEDGADDNDPYYDRTGTVAKNRCLRKDRTTRGTNADAVADSAPGTSAIVTLMSLETSHSRLAQRLAEIRAELAKTPSGTGQQAAEGNDDEDDLDAYMRQITTDVHQGLRQEMARLEQELTSVEVQLKGLEQAKSGATQPPSRTPPPAAIANSVPSPVARTNSPGIDTTSPLRTMATTRVYTFTGGPPADPARDADVEEPQDRSSVWVPPSGQKGDGRTALNDKYGY